MFLRPVFTLQRGISSATFEPQQVDHKKSLMGFLFLYPKEKDFIDVFYGTGSQPAAASSMCVSAQSATLDVEWAELEGRRGQRNR